jgi:hypothetical protein
MGSLSPPSSDASRYLLTRAAQIAAAYVAHAGPRAMLAAGSSAEGVSDYYSDLDLIAYYDQLPTDDQLASAREMAHAVDFRAPAARSEEAYVEEYSLRGIECEVLHTTVAAWEHQMRIVLVELSPTALAQKAIGGLLDGVALHGDELIRRWQARAAAYPEELARVMVEHYLKFFPLWRVQERLASRDAALWYYQVLVESSQNILGVLAGLNHLYYSTFQFKRLGRFIGKMQRAPDRLTSRLENLFVLDRASAAVELERLVGEVVALVEAHMPSVDTLPVRRTIGARQRPWLPPAG